MLSSAAMQRHVFDQVDSAHHVSQLMPMLQYVDIEQVKEMIKNQLKSDNEAVRRSYYAAMPLDDVFPLDVLSKVLSFADRHHHQPVCREWQIICARNSDSDLHDQFRAPVELKPMHTCMPLGNYLEGVP